jgi:hypothetical protein
MRPVRFQTGELTREACRWREGEAWGAVVRGQSSGGRLCSSMADVEVVASGDPSVVLRLGGRYAVIRHEPIEEKMCGAELTEEIGCQWLLRNFQRGAAESDAR